MKKCDRRYGFFQFNINMYGMPLSCANPGLVIIELIPLLIVSANNIFKQKHSEAMIENQILNLSPSMLIKGIIFVMPKEKGQFFTFGY